MRLVSIFVVYVMITSISTTQNGLRIFNDKVFFFPTAYKPIGQLFNFRIFIKLFIHEEKKTSKFWVLGLYLFNKYQ